MQDIGKILILIGLVFLASGLFIFFAGRIPFGFLGKLPGDISYHKNNISVFAPITSMVIISIVLTVVINIFSKWFK